MQTVLENQAMQHSTLETLHFTLKCYITQILTSDVEICLYLLVYIQTTSSHFIPFLLTQEPLSDYERTFTVYLAAHFTEKASMIAGN